MKKKWVDIPVMTDFGEEYIRNSVLADPAGFVMDQIRYEIQVSGVICHPDDMDKEVQRRYDALTDKEYTKAVNDIIDFKLHLMMDSVLEANYRRIQKEAADLINKAWDSCDLADKTDGNDTTDSELSQEPIDDPVFTDPWHDLD